MTNTNSTAIAWGSAAYFDHVLADLLADGCGHVLGRGEKKMRAAARRAAKAGRVTITALEHDGAWAVKAR